MKPKIKFAAFVLTVSAVLVFTPSKNLFSQVAFGISYHSGPLTLAFGSFSCYPPVYYHAPVYYGAGGYSYYHPHYVYREHHKYYRGYGHERFTHHRKAYYGAKNFGHRNRYAKRYRHK